MIKNPKETTYRVKQIGKGVGHVVRESLTPLDQRALNAEGRKLNWWKGLLSNFSKGQRTYLYL